jgi:hypothetical protein
MSNINADRLSQAFEFIEADRFDEAKALLEPILAQEPNNADAWWLYAHAVTDAAEAKRALDRLMALDPQYPGAAALASELPTSVKTPIKSISPIKPITPVTPSAAPVSSPPDQGFGDADAPMLDDEFSPARPSRLPLIVAGIVLLLVVVFGAIFMLSTPPAPTPSPSATAVVFGNTPMATTLLITPAPVDVTVSPISMTAESVVPTEAVTEENVVVTNDAAASEEVPAQLDDLTAVQDALTDFTLSDEGLQVIETSLGPTLVAAVCSPGGAQVRTDLPLVMEALARAASDLTAVNALAARLVSCETNRPFVQMGVPIEQAAAFAAGSLDSAGFQRAWQPQ